MMMRPDMTRRDFVRVGATVVAGAIVARMGAQTSEPVTAFVKTSLGTLRGVNANGVRVFKGVPFAEPPLGALRFKSPANVKRWSGIRDATKFAGAAMQSGDKNVPQSEDCLYLNIWTPADVKADAGLPVFVWIHGGGFTGGNSFAPIFDGTEFAKAGIIVVTVAYRLGIFGFLELEPLLGADYAGSANNALRDLICALRWVQANIGAFGGDAQRVTIGGESAGAKLTDILMGVPEAQGLFSAMISESGGAERVWNKERMIAVGKGFGDVWGPDVASLKTMAAEELIATQAKFVAGWPEHFPLRCELDGVLLPRLPIETIASGSTKGKRLLIGTNRDESALFIGPHPQQDPTASDLGNISLAAFNTVYAKYKDLYPQMSPEQLRIRALTAEEYWVPSTRVVDAHVRGGGKAWMYRLDFSPSSGRMKGEAYHSEDLGLVWDKSATDIENASAEKALAKQIHEAWVAFIEGDAPAANGLPLWREYDVETKSTLILNAASHMEEAPQHDELRLWIGVL